MLNMAVSKKIILTLLLLMLVIIIYFAHANQSFFTTIFNTVTELHGPQAFFYFCLIYILSNLLFLPFGLPLNLLAGVLWGTFWGGALINVLATFVAAISFLFARLLGHVFLEAFFNKYFLLNKFKRLINSHDWQFIFAARINPIVPFSVSNYFFGFIPELPFKRYLFATMLANLAPCFVFASLGAILKTYSIYDNNLRQLLLKIGLSFLLISCLFLIKWSMSNTATCPANIKEEL